MEKKKIYFQLTKNMHLCLHMRPSAIPYQIIKTIRFIDTIYTS
jgi:hypothetical protein